MTTTKYSMLRTIVIDDEDDIREALVSRLEESRYYTVVGQAHSITTALETILGTDCDLIFLDIKIKGGDAFMLLDKLLAMGHDVPPVILNTGFSKWEFAMKALNNYKDVIVELLEKPFWNQWKEAEQRIYYKVKDQQSTIEVTDDILKIQVGKQYYRIPFDDIIYIESDTEKKGRAQSVLVTEQELLPLNMSLKAVLERLPSSFLQINRFTILNKGKVRSYNKSENIITVADTDRSFHVTDSYRDEFLAMF